MGVSQALVDQYNDARASGNTALANYLAQAIVATNNPGADISQVTAAPLTGAAGVLPNTTTAGKLGDAILQGLNPLNLFDVLSGNTTQLNQALQNGTGPLETMGSAVDSAKGALAFISDIPRVITSVLGLILIIAGIFALSRGPAVEIVGGHIKDALTS